MTAVGTVDWYLSSETAMVVTSALFTTHDNTRNINMSMCNSSTANEKLIGQIIYNVKSGPVSERVSRLYNTIINNSILNSITQYEEYVKLTDDDAILHNGGSTKIVTKKYLDACKNTATALRILRQKLPVKQAKFLVSEEKNLTNDSLYHSINDFKFRCNSDFFTLFLFNK